MRRALYIIAVSWWAAICCADGPVFRVSSEGATFPASAVMDGNCTTRWDSERSDPQWVMIDFGEPRELVGLLIDWENAYAYRYMVQLSDDGTHWHTVFETDAGDGGRDSIDFPKQTARHLRLYLQNRATAFGYSIFEIDLKTPEAPWGEHQSPHFFAAPFQRVDETMYAHSYFIPAGWSNEAPFIRLANVPGPWLLSVNGNTVLAEETKRVAVVPLTSFLHFGTTNAFAVQMESMSDCSELSGVLIGASASLCHQSMNDLREKHPTLYYELQARISQEGYYPYWMTKRQGYWTVVGAEDDTRESLFGQDGTLEPYKSFSIVPFVGLDAQLITREDVRLEQSLLDGFLPMPRVRWQHPRFNLDIQAFGWGDPEHSAAYLSYTVTNTSSESISGKLFLAIRPFEVNPPWQWGGVNRIDDLAMNGAGHITANEFTIVPITEPSAFGVAQPDDGDVVHMLAANRLPVATALHHPQGQASGVIVYAFELAAGESASFQVAVPLHSDKEADANYVNCFSACRQYWHGRLHLPAVDAPSHVINSLKANLAYILINRDGPAIQPGSRAYEASWIRDAAGTTKALLRCGYTNEVRDFIAWYSRWLFDDGRVPAIVIHNRKEVNSVKEFDSQGEFIAVVWNYYTVTKDRDMLQMQWTNVLHALKYLEKIRAAEDREFYQQHEDQKRYYGLLPKSVSHEGYYPEPGNHSYWDDFWALKGWSDAMRMAVVLNETNRISWMVAQRHRLGQNVYQSISNTMAYYHIDYLPGCAELGDFDASSSAGAIAYCEQLSILPPVVVSNTFTRYFSTLEKRFDPSWTGSFSPYEFRIVPAMLKMGWANRAQQVFQFLMRQQHPAGWLQWPEALYIPADTPGYIGDMPHTWISGEFINATLDIYGEKSETNHVAECD